MPTAVFTPKQIAQALGVSESSVKRWVDGGRLKAAKTVGGHRKVPLSVVASFIRETGHELVDPAVLGMVTTPRMPLEAATEELFRFLMAGDEAACRDLVLGFYQRGETVADLGDRFIGPAFTKIGDGWEQGRLQVFQERRACEVMMATLHELRRWLPVPPDDAPMAVVATPHQDFAEVPARLVELVLVAAGWRVTVAGSGLPLEEIGDSVRSLHPRLLCLSATHLEDREDFVSRCNTELLAPLASHFVGSEAVHVVAGGRALFGDRDCHGQPIELDCDLIASSLKDLVAYQTTLLGEPVSN